MSTIPCAASRRAATSLSFTKNLHTLPVAASKIGRVTIPRIPKAIGSGRERSHRITQPPDDFLISGGAVFRNHEGEW
jgi:hypothetical protein